MTGGFPPVLAFMGLGATEIGVILLVLVLFFGAAKIPQLAKSIGRAKGEFEKARRDVERELKSDPAPSPTSSPLEEGEKDSQDERGIKG